MLLRTVQHFFELKKNLSLAPSKLREIQRRRLASVVKHAYENVPFYRWKFDHAGVKPQDIKSVEDLSKIPITTKSEIQSSPIGDVLARSVNVEDCVKVNTSGSTGKPLTFYLDKAAADFRFALMSRTYWEDGVRPWRKMACIRYPTSSTSGGGSEYAELSRRKHISVLDSPNQQLLILKNYQPYAIMANPSSLVILAHACDKKMVRLRPHLILTCGELLYENDAALIRSTFGCDSVDDYGCHEIGPLAWECREHAGYHINIDGVVMEFIHDGEPVSAGEEGEIVCTSLVNYSMPFIRYRLHDKGVFASDECPCGRPLPLMKIMLGRSDDFLTTVDGRIIPPRIIGHLFEDCGNKVKQFRLIQKSKDKLMLELVCPEGPLDETLKEQTKTKIARILGDGVQIEFQRVERIQKDDDEIRKLRKVISNVSADWRI